MSERNPANWVEVECAQCGVRFQAEASNVRRGRRKCCSLDCRSNANRTRTPEPIHYAGDVFNLNMDGYYVSNRTNRMLHRIIWEEHHGKIAEKKRIRFRDGVRTHYQIENLYVKL